VAIVPDPTRPALHEPIHDQSTKLRYEPESLRYPRVLVAGRLIISRPGRGWPNIEDSIITTSWQAMDGALVKKS
jgi:hypothetical protein